MLLYYILYSFVWLLTWLPLRVLYLFSDIFYPIVYYVVGYRKSVVRTNLSKSFPSKTKTELRRIERRFYRFFCDLFIETMYEMHIGENEIRKRMTYENIEGILEQYEKNKSVMVMTAHYGNWEWTLAFSLFMPGEHSSNPIYKQLRNPRFNKLIYNLRAKYGAKLIEKKELLRVMFRLQKENQLGNFWMISDQTPNARGLHYWTNFLNQDTPAVVGTEQLARKFDYPVFYAEITRKKRGYYHCEFIPVELEPNKTTDYEITEKYMQLLQKTIETSPEYWLWSHRRWKHIRK
jgi:Kdo2-lipid IVA lauroyltransferase/acyltransferase